MAVAIAIKRGRPYFIPKVDLSKDAKLRLYDKFYEICSTFHYREIMGWSRILGVHPYTVERWKYKMTFPGEYIAQQIIDWDLNGRPWEKIAACLGVADML